MSNRKYLTEETFNKWKDNEFAHFVRRVVRMEGMMWVLVPLLIGIVCLILKFVVGI